MLGLRELKRQEISGFVNLLVDGVFELKLDFGPGYRIYFGYKTDTVFVLLFGGHKKGQQKDIDKAQEYWREYLSLKRGKK